MYPCFRFLVAAHPEDPVNDGSAGYDCDIYNFI